MAFQRRKAAAIGVKAPYPGFIDPEFVPSGTRWIIAQITGAPIWQSSPPIDGRTTFVCQICIP
jgi:hypothetical protein